ncbi:AMP-binding protein [Streptomyces lunalinharesii]|uniref:Fatty acyl-AMP ligase n=1 Tax=Streptomyces lunalinharesii TaxID=333384 RepID=A0ABN3SKA1_9ACTN
MTHLLDLLSDGSHSRATLRFGPDQKPVTGDEVWRRAEDCARWIGARTPAGKAVGMFLTLTPDTVPVVVGAWLAGVDLVSLPLPGRNPNLPGYLAMIEAIVRRLDLTLVLTADGAELPLPSHPALRFAPFAAAREGGPPLRRSRPGALIQFTSGSTGAPKGIRISATALAANVEAVIGRFALDEGVRCCSWLPLSHDMGLIGALLTSWAAAGRSRAGAGDIVLSTPEAFRHDPLSWLRDCSDHGADYTLVPNFALDLVAARLADGGAPLDLRPLRRLVVGSEPISAGTLERFAEAAQAAGLDERALCPAYGMAEVGVGVSAVAPGEVWSAADVDSAALGRNRWLPEPSGTGHRFVGLGRPLDGVEVEVAPEPAGADGAPGTGDGTHGRIGYLRIRTRSLLTEYVTTEGPQQVGEWLRTPDLGYVDASGEIFVTGRSQEVIVVAGRNLYATDIERAAQGVAVVRPGNCAAVPGKSGGYAVIAEPVPAHEIGVDAMRRFRVALVQEVGLGPTEIIFVPRGTLSKTSSGKMRRSEIARQYHKDAYDVIARREFVWHP